MILNIKVISIEKYNGYIYITRLIKYEEVVIYICKK